MGAEKHTMNWDESRIISGPTWGIYWALLVLGPIAYLLSCGFLQSSSSSGEIQIHTYLCVRLCFMFLFDNTGGGPRNREMIGSTRFELKTSSLQVESRYFSARTPFPYTFLFLFLSQIYPSLTESEREARLKTNEDIGYHVVSLP